MAYVAMVHFGVIYWPGYISRITGIFNWEHLDIRICWLSNWLPIDVQKCLADERSDRVKLPNPFLEIKEKIQNRLGPHARRFAAIRGEFD